MSLVAMCVLLLLVFDAGCGLCIMVACLASMQYRHCVHDVDKAVCGLVKVSKQGLQPLPDTHESVERLATMQPCVHRLCCWHLSAAQQPVEAGAGAGNFDTAAA